MNLRDVAVLNMIGVGVPNCILDEPLEKHIPNILAFSSVVLAAGFFSGDPKNPTAVNYVFYFYLGEENHYSVPDDVLTFRIRLDNPNKVDLINKYLGGRSFGAKNAPPLSEIKR